MTPPRRRWFAFSLRTLFVGMMMAAIPLGWLGYSLNWIRERHEEGEPVGAETLAPGGLWIFGEEGMDFIVKVVPAERVDAEKMRLHRLFPEAEIEVRDKYNGISGPGAFPDKQKR